LGYLSVNVSWDTESEAKKFVAEYRLPFPVGRDTGTISSLYGVDSTPNTFFIGKDGKLLERVEGELDETVFEQRINAMLAG